eukprot:6804564-Lingulodinium_polyedra.AAC.1
MSFQGAAFRDLSGMRVGGALEGHCSCQKRDTAADPLETLSKNGPDAGPREMTASIERRR